MFLNIYKQKIRLSHAKNYCEYLSLFDPSDLKQLASFFNGIFPKLTFSFPVHLKQFNSTKIEDSSLTIIWLIFFSTKEDKGHEDISNTEF